MNDFIAQQGWQCPICKTVYSPNTPVCFYCNPNSTKTTATTVLDDKTVWLNQEYHDSIDERNGSGRLDAFIQLPYSLRNERYKDQAKERKVEIENQLENSKYGIVYIDSTEKVTQLNRPR